MGLSFSKEEETPVAVTVNGDYRRPLHFPISAVRQHPHSEFARKVNRGNADFKIDRDDMLEILCWCYTEELNSQLRPEQRDRIRDAAQSLGFTGLHRLLSVPPAQNNPPSQLALQWPSTRATQEVVVVPQTNSNPPYQSGQSGGYLALPATTQTQVEVPDSVMDEASSAEGWKVVTNTPEEGNGVESSGQKDYRRSSTEDSHRAQQQEPEQEQQQQEPEQDQQQQEPEQPQPDPEPEPQPQPETQSNAASTAQQQQQQLKRVLVITDRDNLTEASFTALAGWIEKQVAPVQARVSRYTFEEWKAAEQPEANLCLWVRDDTSRNEFEVYNDALPALKSKTNNNVAFLKVLASSELRPFLMWKNLPKSIRSGLRLDTSEKDVFPAVSIVDGTVCAPQDTDDLDTLRSLVQQC